VPLGMEYRIGSTIVLHIAVLDCPRLFAERRGLRIC
jgi:hypothetical protein